MNFHWKYLAVALIFDNAPKSPRTKPKTPTAGQTDKLSHRLGEHTKTPQRGNQSQLTAFPGTPSPIRVNGNVNAPHCMIAIGIMFHVKPAKYHAAIAIRAGTAILRSDFGA